ncbi:hypothetical protein HJFPF1_11133 [Paramyrothecium foliicola]|nr:hypothetical protein HJFPF1_11133 [Paramyrothecium foliicola]
MADADELAGLGHLEPDIFEGNTTASMFQGLGLRSYRQRQRVQEILERGGLEEPAMIDAIAEASNWFSGDTAVIDIYLSGETNVDATVAHLAQPIDESYSSADHGRMYYLAERTARTQRKYWTPEEALFQWGPEEEFPEPGTTGGDDRPSTETQLWGLWYGVLHAAKRIPWHQSPQQDRLVALVQAFKARPDPPAPSPMTVPLKKEWIWGPGSLWSSLVLLGPSAREVWNDECGCGSGWSEAEQHAWANVNAFVARLTVSGTADFMNYGFWALESLEVRIRGQMHNPAPIPVILGVVVTVAAVWVEIAGQHMYERRIKKEVSQGEDPRGGGEVDLSLRGGQLPWRREDGASAARWRFWRRRLEEEAKNEALTLEARRHGERAAELIRSFEGVRSD